MARAPPDTSDGARQLAGSVAGLRLMLAAAPGAPDLADGVPLHGIPSLEEAASEWALLDDEKPPPVQCASEN